MSTKSNPTGFLSRLVLEKFTAIQYRTYRNGYSFHQNVLVARNIAAAPPFHVSEAFNR